MGINPVGTFVQPDNTTQGGTEYKTNLDGSIAAISRVGTNFAAHEQAVPDMTVRIDAGGVLYGETLATAAFTEVAAQDTAAIVAPVGDPRIDRVVIDMETGVNSVVEGTEAAVPAAPAIPTGKLPNCQILLQTTSTEITNDMITDERSATAIILNSVALYSESYAKLSDVKASGAAGGTFTSGAWQTRTLNTEDVDDDAIVSLAANQFTLAAGTYRFNIIVPAFAVDNHQALLYNVTDASVALLGVNSYCSHGVAYGGNYSIICGQVTIAGAKVFEVRHRCQSTQASNGFGNACNFGINEVYTIVEIWKIN